jgi:hypothetical protein
LFPQEGHPVLTESRVDLPQMQVWVVALSPATELTNLEAVTVLCRLALAIIDCLVVEAERFHANTDDLEAQAIQRFKELPPVEWTWDKFKRKCKDPIRKEGSKLWTNIVTAMHDAGIGEVTKSNPLTFRRHTDVDGHRKMSA